jgi:hypothetical protein
MTVLDSRAVPGDPGSEYRVGVASWDDGSETEFSAKFASRDRNGRVKRCGEIPITALPGLTALAMRNGLL